jgi:hypothetical protein
MGQPSQRTDGEAVDRVCETAHTEREHQTTGKRVGTKNDTCPMGSHATTVEISERSSAQRRQQEWHSSKLKH